MTRHEVEETYKISARIEAEERCLDHALMVFTSTQQVRVGVVVVVCEGGAGPLAVPYQLPVSLCYLNSKNQQSSQSGLPRLTLLVVGSCCSCKRGGLAIGRGQQGAPGGNFSDIFCLGKGVWGLLKCASVVCQGGPAAVGVELSVR